MSAVEILAELPKLTSEERSIIRRRLRELDERDELQFLHESADAMFREMDKHDFAVRQSMGSRHSENVP